ncbi:nitroreductase family protein [Listeria sp. PSOL-1]|uniref:nitroreductase family protein n=1 Tax=Listeria sp. PSOL-1 TaxID=1844999 RepID=UPI0013D249F0|nr:nitroreductase family protein [Listeria sp. PSOL-1]
MSNLFLEVARARRSIYALDKNVTLSENEIEKLIKEAIKLSPSSFNSQSSRAVILFNDHHEKLWNIVEETLRKLVPAKDFASTEEKMASFRAGFGSILFFEDIKIIENLQKKFAAYADKFPVWSEQSSGMAQYSAWTVLANVGIGASLQHYNPLIDDSIKIEWNIPSSWYLRAQMPFGNIASPPNQKEFMDDQERFMIFK